MTTTAQRLASLSGLAGVSAGAHLLAIRQAGAQAGPMLVSRSGLGVASALQHLLAALVVPSDDFETESSGGGHVSLSDWLGAARPRPSSQRPLRNLRRRRTEEFLLLQIF